MEWEELRRLSKEQLHYILSYFDIMGEEVLLAKERATNRTCFLIRSKCPCRTYKIVNDGIDNIMYIDRSVTISA